MSVCCMTNCDLNGGGSKARHFFPFPIDLNQCMLWIYAVERRDYYEEFAFAGAQPFVDRHLCSRHFTEDDYINPLDLNLGLKPTAVPKQHSTFTDINAKPLFTFVKEEPIDYIEPVTVDPLNNEDYQGETASSDSFLSYKGHFLTKEPFENNFGICEPVRITDVKEEVLDKKKKEALRSSMRRIFETEEQAKQRRMKNAMRASFRRLNETPHQRAERRRKDMLRATEKRKWETDEEVKIRRYNDAVRAAFRRSHETEQQRQKRKEKDIMRAARRRTMETPEQRESRLHKDRMRAKKRRMLKRIAEQIGVTDAAAPLSYTSDDSSNSIDKFKQLLELIDTDKKSKVADDCGARQYSKSEHWDQSQETLNVQDVSIHSNVNLVEDVPTEDKTIQKHSWA